MNFKQIEYALELSRTLNFRRAAENLYISQPALSYQIQTLEQELGVTLFDRSGRGVSLTPAGSVFCRDMRGIYDRSRDTVTRLQNCGRLCEDTLRVGAFHSHSLTVLPRILGQFTENHPNVLLDLRRIHGAGRIDALFRGELDLIFFDRDQLPATPDLQFLPLIRSQIYCVLHCSHPLACRPRLTPEDLRDNTVYLCSGHGPQALLQAQNRLKSEVPVRPKLCQDADTALLWVCTGQGAALMPGFCYIPNPALVWIPYGPADRIESGLAWQRAALRPVMEEFCSTALEVYRELSLREDAVL